jgi:hypothetical protein
LPTSLPNPCPTPGERVAALTEALVWERDSARRAVARLESELATEREPKRATEARAKASW